MKRWSRGDTFAIVFLCLALLIVFADVLFLGRNFYFRDLTRFHYPAKKLMHDMVRGGTFPWWNPTLAAGQPLAANPQYELFYPPQWLIFLPDFYLGYRLHILLHFFIAALGMFLLLRDARLRPESALFGSIAFTLGGLFVSSVNLLPFLFSLSWVPWIAFFLRRWVRSGRWGDFAGGSLAFGMQLLVGEPFTASMTALAIVAYGLFRHRNVRALARLAAVAVAAFAVACVLIVPGFDFARETVRSRAFPFSVVSIWSAPPLKFLELLLPGFMGSGSEHCLFYWGTAKEGWRDPYYISLYFGLLPLALAIGAMRARVAGWWIVLIACAAAAWLAIGSHTPLLHVLYDWRIFTTLRYPEKFVMIGIVPLTIFAAFAFDRVLDGDRRIVPAALAVTATAAVIALGLFVFSMMPSYPSWFVSFWGIEFHPLALLMARLSSRTWLLDFVRASLVFAVLVARPRLGAARWSWLAILLLTADLGVERASVAESADASLFTRRPAAASVLAAGGGRLFHQADWYTAAVTARRYYDLPEAYRVMRNGLFPNIGEGRGVASVLDRDVDETHLRSTAAFVDAMWKVKALGRTDWLEIFAAMSNAGWRTMYLPFDQAVARAAGDQRRIQPVIFLPVATNPRFYFADQIVPCRGAREFVALLASRDWSRRAAFMDAAAFTPASGSVLGTTESPDRFVVRVRAAGEALLVSSITGQRYWRARLDGSDVPILATNITYQAVRIPAGEHTLVLKYRNPLIMPCAALSLLAVAALLSAAAYDSRHHDRSEC